MELHERKHNAMDCEGDATNIHQFSSKCSCWVSDGGSSLNFHGMKSVTAARRPEITKDTTWGVTTKRWGIYRWYTILLSEKKCKMHFLKNICKLFKQTFLGCWQPRQKDPWRVDDEEPNNLEKNMTWQRRGSPSWQAQQNHTNNYGNP